jgi:hypothetical protein
VPDLTNAEWRKSTRSNNGGECVEVADNLTSVIAVRDSKDPTGLLLTFTPVAWAAFVTATKHDTFDR